MSIASPMRNSEFDCGIKTQRGASLFRIPSSAFRTIQRAPAPGGAGGAPRGRRLKRVATATAPRFTAITLSGSTLVGISLK